MARYLGIISDISCISYLIDLTTSPALSCNDIFVS